MRKLITILTVMVMILSCNAWAQITAEEIGTTAQQMHEQGKYDGVIVLADGDKVLHQAVYGLAHRGLNVKNTLETRFNTASMYKMFTAVAIMQLQEKGMLNLDDTVDKWLSPQWLPEKIASQITVKHLLSHTSGLGSYWGEEYENTSKTNFMTLDDYKSLVSAELAHDPGEGFTYSNTGFLLLGVIIEKVSGSSYFDYTSEHVFKPAGMDRTGCYRLDRPVENMATGYYQDPEDGQIYNNTYLHVARGGPAGGGYTTAADLLRFARALRSETLVKKSTFKLMTASSSQFQGYGLGFGDLGEATGHNGGFPGISAVFLMHKENGKVAVALSNFGSIRPLQRPFHSFVTNAVDQSGKKKQ